MSGALQSWLYANVGEPVLALRRLSKRQVGLQVLNFAVIVCTALMVWKGLSVLANTESPIVVVLSGSMEPGMERGDLLLLSMSSEAVRVGDICVFKLEGRDVPIVHRVLKTHEYDENGKELILTKGDNNYVDDRSLYNEGQLWIHREHIVGRAQAFIPYAGMLTIYMNDYPSLKFVLLASLAVFVLITREY